MTRYAKRVDSNHAEILGRLKAVRGMAVLDTSSMGGLGCDLLCRYQDGPPVMLEIKSDGKKPLTDSERKLKDMFTGYWFRVESFEQALAVFGISYERAPF